MKTTRTLATAVAAAVTAPVLLLAATTPAYATTVTPPPAPPAVAEPSSFTKGPSIADLEKAVAKARKAHEEAVAAKEAAYEVLVKELRKDYKESDWPEAIALVAAEKAATEAATTHTTAVKALEEAKAKLAALPETATEEERKAAEKAVTEAQTAADTAAAAKTLADQKRADAHTAFDDRRVAMARQYSVLTEAVKKAAADLAAAEKALADAKKDQDDDNGMCAGDDALVAELTGLPEKVTAGTPVDLTVRVTNNTGEAVDRAFGQVTLEPGGEKLVPLFKPQYRTATSDKWRDWNSWGVAVNVGGLKPGAHADLKLRLNPAASLKDWSGSLQVNGWYERGDDCGANTTLKSHTFQVVAPAVTPPPTTAPNTPTQQGGTTTTPLTGGTTTTTGGTLAKTGSSDALGGLAAASGAAVALGAAAVFATRRRRTTDA
ncbi:peptidase [Streptomyces sp. enrichment culture]|uniref:peptidase n=1 Tax=Streptomyces sp. enrichment culture TaxID=1795815 RepID=UPI003F54A931